MDKEKGTTKFKWTHRLVDLLLIAIGLYPEVATGVKLGTTFARKIFEQLSELAEDESLLVGLDSDKVQQKIHNIRASKSIRTKKWSEKAEQGLQLLDSHVQAQEQAKLKRQSKEAASTKKKTRIMEGREEHRKRTDAISERKAEALAAAAKADKETSDLIGILKTLLPAMAQSIMGAPVPVPATTTTVPAVVEPLPVEEEEEKSVSSDSMSDALDLALDGEHSPPEPTDAEHSADEKLIKPITPPPVRRTRGLKRSGVPMEMMPKKRK